jgi:hypothetical protein
MMRHATGMALVIAAAPLVACDSAAPEVDEARDRALSGGKADSLDAAPPATIELMASLPGYYVLESGEDSEGALRSLWLESSEVTTGGVAAGESRRRSAGPCEAYDCGFVISDAYQTLPAPFGINEGYLLLDAASSSPTEFYAISHVEFDGRGEIASIELRYSPSSDVIYEPFVLRRFGDAELRQDIDIATMNGLPGHYTRDDVDPAAGELVSVQFGIDETSRDGEMGGSFIRQMNVSCEGAGCNREAGDRYLAVPENFLDIAHVTFHEGTTREDRYIVDEVVRDSVGTIIRLSVRRWGETDMGAPFSLTRLGYSSN